MFNLLDFFPSSKVAQPSYPRSFNSEAHPNAGNFQEYNYELEWMECHWNHVYQCIDMVTAYWYPWIDRKTIHNLYPDLYN